MEEDLSNAIEQLPDPHLRGLMSLCFTKYKAGEFTKQEMAAALDLESAVEKECVDGIHAAMAAFDGLTLTTAMASETFAQDPTAPARVVRTRSADTASSVSTVSVNKNDFDDDDYDYDDSTSSSSSDDDDDDDSSCSHSEEDEDESIKDSRNGSCSGGPPRVILVPRDAMMVSSPTFGRKVGTPRSTSRNRKTSLSLSGDTTHTRVSQKIEEIEARRTAALDQTCHTRCSVVSQHIEQIEGKLSTHSRSLRRSNSVVLEAIKDIEEKILSSKVSKGILTALRTFKKKDKNSEYA